jgi:hypothetical protein
MRPLLHGGVLVGKVQSADGVSRSSSAGSIHDDAWVQAVKSGVNHM